VTPRAETIFHPIKDLERTKDVFRSLRGAEPVLDGPYYVQFGAGGQQIGLDPHGHDQDMSGPVVYWHVDDIRRNLAALLDSGAT
jgi:hypothetical protein